MTKTNFNDINTWVFDLDHTLYPPSVNLFSQIEEKMRDFVAKFLNIDANQADHLRAKYWASHGTTLAGMMDIHAMPPEQFLIDVHDIDFACLPPSPRLAQLISALPGRKIVYTNGTEPYARRVLAARGLADEFEAVYGIEHAAFHPKPAKAAFDMVFDTASVIPSTSAMFEDDPRNLKVPFALGMKTIWIDPKAKAGGHINEGAADLEDFLEHLVATHFPFRVSPLH